MLWPHGPGTRSDTSVDDLRALGVPGWPDGPDRHSRGGRPGGPELTLAGDLVQAGAAGIVTTSVQAEHVIRRTCSTIPVVFAANTYLVDEALVSCLDRLGGTASRRTLVTGLGLAYLRVLKEAVPGISRPTVLRDPREPATGAQVNEIRAAADGVDLSRMPMEARQVAISPNAVAASHVGADASIVLPRRPGREVVKRRFRRPAARRLTIGGEDIV
jgi:hypothetical protein